MMRKTNRVLYITLFLTILSLSHAQKDIPQLVEEIKPAVVTILTFDSHYDTLALGSGFFVNSNGHIITNLHVLKGAYSAKAKTADGKVYYIENVLAENQDADLILVSMPDSVQDFEYVDLATTLPIQGEHIVVFGSPFGLELSVSDGIVAAVRELPGFGSIIQLTAPISAGSSGGPVVDMHGKVIGIATLQVIEGQNLNFAIPAKFILELEPSKEDYVIDWTLNKSKKIIQTGDSLYDCAITYYWLEDYEKAVLHFQYAAELYGELTNDMLYSRVMRSHYNSLLFSGACYRKIGQREKEMRVYSTAISIIPDYGEAYDHLAHVYWALGRYAEAIYEYKRAIKADPDYYRSYCNLGARYFELEMYNESMAIFNQLSKLSPNHVSAHIGLGQVYFELELYEKAAEAYIQAVQLDPDDDTLYVSVGLALAYDGEPAKAIVFIKRSLAINPDNVDAHYLLGLTFLDLDDVKAALDEYMILKELDPVLADALFESIFK
jgi:tetratricopeptide (TPR) repeat protein